MSSKKKVPRDAGSWAKPVSKLRVSGMPEDATGLNVEGRQVVGPIQGFGALWQKKYKVSLEGARVSPQELITTWKENFASFWPEDNSFYAPLTGIKPGEVGLLRVTMPGRLKLSTGVLVLYADDESFTFVTPQGHMLAGWITFSSFVADSEAVAQAEEAVEAHTEYVGDPLVAPECRHLAEHPVAVRAERLPFSLGREIPSEPASLAQRPWDWGGRSRTSDHGTKTRCLTTWLRPNKSVQVCQRMKEGARAEKEGGSRGKRCFPRGTPSSRNDARRGRRAA